MDPMRFSVQPRYVSACFALPDLKCSLEQYWCWWGKTYVIHRLLASYIWKWTALLTSLIVYIPLFFWGRGNITIGDKPYKFRIHRQGHVYDPEGRRRRSLSMLAYVINTNLEYQS